VTKSKPKENPRLSWDQIWSRDTKSGPKKTLVSPGSEIKKKIEHVLLWVLLVITTTSCDITERKKSHRKVSQSRDIHSRSPRPKENSPLVGLLSMIKKKVEHIASSSSPLQLPTSQLHPPKIFRHQSSTFRHLPAILFHYTATYSDNTSFPTTTQTLSDHPCDHNSYENNRGFSKLST
jgi:hypothetical protein